MGNIKRSLDGTYHAFRFFKYALRYLAEGKRQFSGVVAYPASMA